MVSVLGKFRCVPILRCGFRHFLIMCLQIWFQVSLHCGSMRGNGLIAGCLLSQNQRQKARRPRGQPTALLTRPPQYGPFSNMPPSSVNEGGAGGSPTRGGESYSMAMAQYSSAGPSRRLETESERYQPYMAQPYPRSLSLSQLSGPGIPGPSSGARPQYPLPLDAQMAAESSARVPRGYPGPGPQPAYPSVLPPVGEPSLEAYRLGHQRARSRGAAVPGNPRQQQLDYPITLPPIVETPHTHAVLPGPSTAGVYPPLAPISTLTPVPPPSAMAEHQRRRSSSQAESPFAHAPTMNLPPPFTMQPRPQWDDTALSPFSRPGSSSLSRPGSSYDVPSGPIYAVPSGMEQYRSPGASVPPPSGFSPTRPHEAPYSRAAPGQTSPFRRFDSTGASHPDDPTHSDPIIPRPRPDALDDDTVHDQHHAKR